MSAMGGGEWSQMQGLSQQALATVGGRRGAAQRISLRDVEPRQMEVERGGYRISDGEAGDG